MYRNSVFEADFDLVEDCGSPGEDVIQDLSVGGHGEDLKLKLNDVGSYLLL